MDLSLLFLAVAVILLLVASIFALVTGGWRAALLPGGLFFWSLSELWPHLGVG